MSIINSISAPASTSVSFFNSDTAPASAIASALARKWFKTGGAQLHNMASCRQVAFVSRLCYCKRVGSKWLVVFFRTHLCFK